MPVNNTHPDYDAALPAWTRARDVMAGEDAIKAAGIRYLSKLDSQTEEEYTAYKSRASFFNATARTAEVYLGLIFRRPPFIKVPDDSSALAKAMQEFVNDTDMLGSPLPAYAKSVVNEIITVGRAGTLIDWEDTVENRVYASLYRAEQIINWRVERINGRNVPTMVVLSEVANDSTARQEPRPTAEKDEFEHEAVEQIRVLRLVPATSDNQTATRAEGRHPNGSTLKREYECVVEIWREEQSNNGRRSSTAPPGKEKDKWELVETRVPKRLGKPVTGHFKTSHQWAIQNQPLRGGGFIAGAGICSRGLAAS
jgi:hypothetical protein